MNDIPQFLQKAIKEDGEEFLNLAIKKYKFDKKFKKNVVLLSSLSLVFFILGIVLLVFNLQIVQIKVQYQDQCDQQASCDVAFHIGRYMKKPIYFYYQLDDYYQIHQNFYNSFNLDQLKGKIMPSSDLDSCKPYITNSQMGITKSIDGTTLSQSDPANPCGLMPKTYFTDTYQLFNSNDVEIAIDESNIIESHDKNKDFSHPSSWKSIQWVDTTDEHFMVWMKAETMGSIRKIWGKINQNLQIGDYKMTIANNYDIKEYKASKSFVLSTTNAFGQKNTPLVITYLVSGFICLILLVIIIRQNKKFKGE